ncbi:MAG: hypothetical protein ACKVHT_03810 [Flavobacteriales bacterium]|jgi:hypothetical protein|tara:strand:- start:330 stop:905 length:576 start_codon:yes stop_codon:yes gene_type:complete
MNSTFLRIVGLVFFLSVTSCEINTSKSKNDQSEALDSIAQPIAILPEARTFFIPKNTKVLDSTLYLNEAFNVFKKNIEMLSKLDPTSLDLYIIASLGSSNKLLNATLPVNFDVPAINSRIRVVKTQLLRCKYYSQQEDFELLNLGLTELFDSYDILLKRIDDIALSEDALSGNEFSVKKELEEPMMRLRKN